MDGLYNIPPNNEQTRQAELSKHRLLRINLSSTGLKEPGDASSYGSASPYTQGEGPHFILSPITPDNSHTYGFEFCLWTQGMSPVYADAQTYDITIWALVGNGQVQDLSSATVPIWAAYATVTGAKIWEMYHSFDCNASAIRFQIAPGGDDTQSASIGIALCEL